MSMEGKSKIKTRYYRTDIEGDEPEVRKRPITLALSSTGSSEQELKILMALSSYRQDALYLSPNCISFHFPLPSILSSHSPSLLASLASVCVFS